MGGIGIVPFAKFGFVYEVLFQRVFNHGGDICFGFFGVSLIDVV